jgi:hypothetical protein
MSFALLDLFNAWIAPLLGQGGFITSGHGVPHARHEPMEVGIAAMLGALGGFIVGLVLARLIRFVAYLAGRELPTGKWAIYGAILGAIIAVLWETLGD